MKKKNGLAITACIFYTKRYIGLYWYHSHNEIRQGLIAYSKSQRFLDLPVLLDYPDLTFHQSYHDKGLNPRQIDPIIPLINKQIICNNTIYQRVHRSILRNKTLQ